MSEPSAAAPSRGQSISIRRATAADASECGRICFEAFHAIATKHDFPPDVPAPEFGVQLMSMVFSHPRIFSVVAEGDGKILGNNCLDERGAIAGVGPITIDPTAQNRSVGRQLMQAVMKRASEQKFAGVRLVQAGYHMRSLSLYAKLGFVVREPLACIQGTPPGKTLRGYAVRPAQPDDIDACNRLCMQVHGHDRGGELSDAIEHGAATVVESRGRITGYSSGLAFFGHSVAETNEDLQALIGAATEFRGPGILVPMRNTGLFRWCLENGLRVTQPLNLMTMGLYNEPVSAYLPSILY